MGDDILFSEYIYKKIVNDRYSPKAIINEIKHNNLNFKTSICVNTLYNYIRKGIFHGITLNSLPMPRKKNAS